MSEKPKPATTNADLSPDLATRMLRLGMVGPRRGVDDVIDRLRTPDGWQWWEGCMSELGEGSAADAATRLVKGRADLAFITSAKELHKSRMAAGNPVPQRLASMAAYYACIAAALVHHKKAITGQSPELLSEALADLAASTPEPWSDLIGKAALTLSKDK
ncbi:MAG: hypothetical protein KF678_02995 [Phycisphaeraceae bacterium]|nr:hypothetical protein [Phycisphaeraceae bacterium]